MGQPVIRVLDNLLRELFMTRVTGLRPVPPGPVTDDQVRFQPPDETWRTDVGNLQRNALNVYLVELRENPTLRSNERLRSITNGVAAEEPAPARVDCHYLISAWSPAAVSPAVEPALDEHSLLYETAATLVRHAPLNPSRIYPPGAAALAAVPEPIRDADLPTRVAPADGFAKLAEFWGTMGATHRWKPVVHLVVTLPVALPLEIVGPLVTTRVTEYRRGDRPGTAEVSIQIAGRVLNATGVPAGGMPPPVAGAWVRLETPAGVPLQTTETNSAGRFTFLGLRADRYRLRARATGLGERTREIDVPASTGEYDLRFP